MGAIADPEGSWVSCRQHSLDKGQPPDFRLTWKRVGQAKLGVTLGEYAGTWRPGSLLPPSDRTSGAEGERGHRRERPPAGNLLNSKVPLGSGRPSLTWLRNRLSGPLRGRLRQGGDCIFYHEGHTGRVPHQGSHLSGGLCFCQQERVTNSSACARLPPACCANWAQDIRPAPPTPPR